MKSISSKNGLSAYSVSSESINFYYSYKVFKFSPVGDASDVDMDTKPERPENPGDNTDLDVCNHDWVESAAEYVSGFSFTFGQMWPGVLGCLKR